MQRAREIGSRATAWLIRLEREATPELWEELQQWLDSQPRHRAEFIRQRTAWNRCDKLKMLRPDDGRIDADLLSGIELVPPRDIRSMESEYAPGAWGADATAAAGNQGRFSRATGLSRRVWLAAAAVAGLAVLAVWYLASQRGWQTYVTAIGGEQHIALRDGSTVELNTNSAIRVRMSTGQRDIVLVYGEALFHVMHDAKRPFLVTASGTLVQAVGTAFSVRIRDNDRVEVLVTDGRVAFGTPRPDATDEPVLSATAHAVSKGQDAALSHGSMSLTDLSPQEMARRLAWTGGKLSFQGATLSEAVAEFNRYNVRHLSIADPSILQMSIGITPFNSTDLDSFLGALEQFHIIALRSGDGREVRLLADPKTRAGAPRAPSIAQGPSTLE